MICSSLNLVFFTSVSSRRRTLAQTGGVSGEHVSGLAERRVYYDWVASNRSDLIR
jgi:hypothetical protein